MISKWVFSTVAITVRLVDDALNQAKLDWQQTQDTGALEKAIKLEQEKNRLRIELEEARQPGKDAKAQTAADKAKGIKQQQVTNRVRAAKNSAIKAIRQHELKLEGVSELDGMDSAQIRRVREIIQKMDITGDETTNEIIRRAVDLLGIETGISGHAEVSASELLGPDEESTDFITDEELLR